MKRAILTADVDQSTKMEQSDLKMLIQRVEEEREQLLAQGIISTSEFFRGDSFQMVVANPMDALEVTMRLKTLVNQLWLQESNAKRSAPIKYSITIAIGLGDPNAETDIRTNNEDVFVRSGRGLEWLKEEKHSLGVFSANEAIQNEMQCSLYLWNHIMTSWKLTSAMVFYQKLLGAKETEIAEKLDVSQSAVNQSARKAGWHAYQRLNHRFRQLVETQL